MRGRELFGLGNGDFAVMKGIGNEEWWVGSRELCEEMGTGLSVSQHLPQTSYVLSLCNLEFVIASIHWVVIRP